MKEVWTTGEFNLSLKNQKIFPLYFLFGDESFLLDEAVDSLTKMLIPDSMKDFNFNSFYAHEVEVQNLRDAIETLPVMATRRVVILKEAHDLKDKEWEELLPIIENPVDSTTWICVAQKADKRKKFLKAFLEHGVVSEFKRPFENQIPQWISAIARKHSLKIDSEASQVLHQLVGNDLAEINSELKKLSQFLGDRNQVLVDDVLEAVSHVRINSIFELTDAIGRNDRAYALVSLANLLENGGNEVAILSLISRHFRILKLVSEGLHEQISGQRLSQRAGVSPYFLKQYIEQVKFWQNGKLESTFRALLDTDRALKASPVASHIWLENFIIHACEA